MKSTKLKLCLIGLGLASIIFGTYSFNKYGRKAAQERLKAVASHGAKAKTRDIMFRNLAFCLAEGQPGQELTVADDSILKNEQQFQQIRGRIRWISSDPEMDVRAQITFGNQNVDKKMYFYVVYGVRAIEVPDASGGTNLYALEPISGGYGLSGPSRSTDAPVPSGLISPKREDFANAKDIDWMFGMDDFTEKVSNIKE